MSSDCFRTELVMPEGWLLPADPDAYQGLTGALVEAIAPHTEADPIAMLAQLLVASGAVIGRGAYVRVDATRHHPNEFIVLVADSSKARTNSSWDHVARLMAKADPSFSSRVCTGLSSGEGLVWALRDANRTDPRERDPRLCVLEPEFASVIKACSREQNTLSPVLRSAWDAQPLALLTRTAPARATAGHLCVVGHITRAEMCAHATKLEVANGLLSRFCFIACRRVRLLPEGGDPDPLANSGLEARLAKNLARARKAGEVRFATTTRASWSKVYQEFSKPISGLVGSVLCEAEAHVARLSLLYALIDGADAIHPCHLSGALALFEYASRSAFFAFEQASADPLAERIHAALLSAADGLTRTELRDLFSRNRPSAAVDASLECLARSGRDRSQRVTTAGRPARVWSAVTPT